MEDACSGESLAFNRLLGNGLMARSGKRGDAVSGDRAMDRDGDVENGGGLVAVAMFQILPSPDAVLLLTASKTTVPG